MVEMPIVALEKESPKNIENVSLKEYLLDPMVMNGYWYKAPLKDICF